MKILRSVKNRISLVALVLVVSLAALSEQGWGYVRSAKPGRGKVGIGMEALMIAGILAFFGYIVISQFWPTAQTANTAIQANTATDTGTTTSKTFFSIGLWGIVAGVMIALIVKVIKMARG